MFVLGLVAYSANPDGVATNHYEEQGKGIALVVTIEARGKDDSGGDGDVGETEEELERRACEEEEALQL
ncbi:hypothetical protein HID58_001274 [Brassica napus]|uniref:Uncharacterized protein n=1 Tax=Brassica napus TaxID=3708 RepID=A0ABQ8EIX0_BRANA|nr:hypothetical protein HID58_001274 [Brassica napus]